MSPAQFREAVRAADWVARYELGSDLLGWDEPDAAPMREPVKRTPYFNQELPEFGYQPIAVIELDGHTGKFAQECHRCGAKGGERRLPCIAVEYIPRDRMRRAQEEKH